MRPRRIQRLRSLLKVPRAPGGATQITGAATSITALVGPAEGGVRDRPIPCGSVAEFEQKFGAPARASPLGHAVDLFFANDGSRAVVVSTAPESLPGDPGMRGGIQALDGTDFQLLYLASGPAAALIPEQLALAAQYCRRRRAFLIADIPAQLNSDAERVDFANGVRQAAGDAASDMALYLPDIEIRDPQNANATVAVGPGAAVAGVIARTDAVHGVWKAPAGSHARIQTAAALVDAVSDDRGEALKQAGINWLRTLPGLGTVVWGARTLAPGDVTPEWRYVNVRRLAVFLEHSIDSGLQWVSFEPASEELYARVRESVERFLHGLFAKGAFAGTRPSEAYFVRCAESTITQEDLDRGRLVVRVGFAALRPSEFIHIAITLGTGGGKRRRRRCPLPWRQSQA